MKPMSNRERIEAVLNGEKPDMIPFTAYFDQLPRGEMERSLRNEGLAIIEPMFIVKQVFPHSSMNRKHLWKDGQTQIRETWETPVGSIWRDLVFESGYGSEFTTDYFVKGPGDYKILEFIFHDMTFLPNFEEFLYVENRLGNDGMTFARTPRTPYQQLMIEWLGIERMAVDLYEQCEALMMVIELLEKRELEFIEVLRKSPARVIWIPDNITNEMIGKSRFEKYCQTSYRKYADVLHDTDKLIAVHMDGKLAGLSENIKNAPIDVIEAFTPPPDGDISVTDAQREWPDKILWLNFTSSMHLASYDQIVSYTRELVDSLIDKSHILVGITENIPSYRWSESLPAILSVLRDTPLD